MQSLRLSRALAALFAFASLTAQAVPSQAAPWTYRGTLNDGGQPANGRYDIRLSLLDAGGAKSLAYPLTFSGVEVKNGAFAVDVDFGIDLAQFGTLKLQTEVAQGDSGFVALGEPRSFDAKAALAGVCWETQGNAGTNDASDFLGTTDSEHLILKAGNSQVMRFAAPNNVIGGSSANNVDTFGGSSQTIAGGGSTATTCGGGSSSCANQVLADFGSIGGGGGNYVFGNYATIAGGNANDATGHAAAVIGGRGNGASASFATVAGGLLNSADGFGSAVGGGSYNLAEGYDNGYSTVTGGYSNRALGDYATVPGGRNNEAKGDNSFAAGRSARVRGPADTGEVVADCGGTGTCGDEGTFIWADAHIESFSSSGSNQFLIRADGGFHLNDPTPASAFDDVTLAARANSGDADFDLRMVTRSGKEYLAYVIDGTGTLILKSTQLAAGSDRLIVLGGSGGPATLSNGGVWTNASSRTFKEQWSPVDPAAILAKVAALPISEWQYKGSAEGRHLGPMAEDFKAAFDLAGDGRSIATVDADGVALAAIQGLNAKLEDELQQSRAQNAHLRTQIEQLATRLVALEAKDR